MNLSEVVRNNVTALSMKEPRCGKSLNEIYAITLVMSYGCDNFGPRWKCVCLPLVKVKPYCENIKRGFVIVQQRLEIDRFPVNKEVALEYHDRTPS
jgi:hypothetical protein